MSEEGKDKGECCSSKGKCCGFGKLITLALVAMLLIGFGYCLGKGGCPFKTCPLGGQTQMQK